MAVTAILSISAWGRLEAAPSGERLQRIEIANGWRIKSVAPRVELDAAILAEAAQGLNSQGWMDAGVMPATVHDILLRLGKIEAPWLPHGTEKCFWVGQQDWVYAVRFAVEDQGREARLRFQGLENKVDVYLNAERPGSHTSKLPLTIDVSVWPRGQGSGHEPSRTPARRAIVAGAELLIIDVAGPARIQITKRTR